MSGTVKEASIWLAVYFVRPAFIQNCESHSWSMFSRLTIEAVFSGFWYFVCAIPRRSHARISTLTPLIISLWAEYHHDASKISISKRRCRATCLWSLRKHTTSLVKWCVNSGSICHKRTFVVFLHKFRSSAEDYCCSTISSQYIK